MKYNARSIEGIEVFTLEDGGNITAIFCS